MRLTFLTVTLFALTACGGGSSSNSNVQTPVPVPEPEPERVLELSFSQPPIDLPGIKVSYAENVAYDEHELNQFDVYLPDCEGPTPLVIHIHGGGFTGGDKSTAHATYKQVITDVLSACVAFATTNYRLLEVPAEVEGREEAAKQGGVLRSLQDSARALQFMRYHFSSLNIDPENVALYGGSAGAGTSLWLGSHDDLADPENDDPIRRESTRVKAVGALATQSTYDLVRWEEILLPVTSTLAPILGGTDILTMAETLGATSRILSFLGIATVDEIDTPENQAYRADIDMLALMDASDAPVYVQNWAVSLEDPVNAILHHPLHALAVKARADEVGLHSVGYSNDPVYFLEDPSAEDLSSFLIRHIK